ncbi:MAG TPA: signal peptidase II, partial [Verrucomicrobiae bacterium]|nr:signal peptidase II [Verrucomicrobiae bacterium]
VTLILFYFIFYFVRNKSELNYFEATGFSLVFGGAISNLVDRLTLGYVRDFLDVSLWSVFNFADVAIATGLLLIVFGKIFQKHFESGKVIK